MSILSFVVGNRAGLRLCPGVPIVRLQVAKTTDLKQQKQGRCAMEPVFDVLVNSCLLSTPSRLAIRIGGYYTGGLLKLTRTRVTSLNFDPDIRHYDWQPVQSVPEIPQAYRYWIELPGSLTQALRQRSRQFSVQVQDERSLALSPAPALLNPGADTEVCWSRKVRLCDGATPWVAAHTLIRQSSLRQGLDELTRLNDRPLGELLFTTPGVTKDSLEVAQTPVGWARRSRYWLEGHPLLVAEFFLDELLHYEHQRLAALSETDSS